MDPVLKKKWVVALRSGKYEQGKEALRNGDKYCCLGVLCEIETGAKPNKVPFPSNARKERLGLTSKECDTLAEFNDGNGPLCRKPWSFKRIATWIEKNL